MTAKKPKSEHKPIGRPSKFGKVKPEQIEKLAKAGWTDVQMADFCDVTEQTWNNWKKQHPAFFESLKDWKAEADHKVERRLYERATGYTCKDTHVSNYQGVITKTKLKKHYPPDTTAAIFWLKNRKSKQWRDKQDHHHSGMNGGPIETITTTMSAAEAAAAYADTLNDE